MDPVTDSKPIEGGQYQGFCGHNSYKLSRPTEGDVQRTGPSQGIVRCISPIHRKQTDG